MHRKPALLVLAGIYALLLVYLRPWIPIVDPRGGGETLSAFIGIVTLVGLILTSLALFFGKDGARVPFLIFNFIYLIFGGFAVYFYWTFWLFQEPTIMDRVITTAAPFVIGIVLPIALFRYFLRKK